MILHFPEILNGEDKSSQLMNTIRNHYRHIRKFAKRTQTDSFRIYDRDLAAYPFAIDYYAGHFSVHYFSSNSEDEVPINLKQEIEECLSSLFGTNSSDIHWRTRKKTKITRQYEKLGEQRYFFITHEYGVPFKVNLDDYLDTGLFLDHRQTRQIVASHCKGKRLLNLFAYTCSFSVHAAIAGAVYTKSVDMSNTYTEWGRDNFKLNQLKDSNHEIIRADCLKFLDLEISERKKYDIIVIDPPTISRSKKMDQLFDIQIDYMTLIEKGLKLLLPGGLIFFSTNSRKFRFDETIFPTCKIYEITSLTKPFDVHRTDNHRCWKICNSPI